ncbi:MAG: hypothetical protein C4294_18650 [Nitrospiraceae bacterium]
MNGENKKVGRPRGSYRANKDVAILSMKTTRNRKEQLERFAKLNNVSQNKYTSDALDRAFEQDSEKFNNNNKGD